MRTFIKKYKVAHCATARDLNLEDSKLQPDILAEDKDTKDT